MSDHPLQEIIEKIESCITHRDFRKYIAQLILDARYSDTYLDEAWEVIYPNPAERLHYMKVATTSKSFIPFE